MIKFECPHCGDEYEWHDIIPHKWECLKCGRVNIIETDYQKNRIAELDTELDKIKKLIGVIPEGQTCAKCDRLVFPLGIVICELTGETLVDDDIPLSQIDFENVKKCAACLAAFPNGNKEYLELDAKDKRIAELEVELAKLRELIGFIPKGKSCRGCDSNVGTIGDYYTTSLCDLFGEFCFNDEKCAACIAAFPNGNKGE